MTDFNANFTLFPAQEKKSERSPDFSGTIEIPVSELEALKAHLSSEPETNWKDEPVIKLRLAGWNSTSKGGKQYLNGKVSTPLPPTTTPTQQQPSNNSLF